MTDDPPKSELILYQTEDGKTRVACRLEDETIWLTQSLLGELFDKDVRTINEHLANIYSEGELTREATIRNFRIVRTEGKREVSREIEHYNLQAIIAVGMRVRSQRGTQFRQWANTLLSEYLVKGFLLDDQRLKRTDTVVDHFDELLARIRDIRASEARVYQQIRNIFALAEDYVPSSEAAQEFFAKMQNKMIFAATGMTAAEVVRRRADADKPNMGLTSWSGARVLKRDIGTSKNYLGDDEIDTLNRITVMFLDQAEFRAKRRQGIRTNDWAATLDKFLADNEVAVLSGLGKISHEEATSWANAQYELFSERRRLEVEAQAEARYLEDLAAAAKHVEAAKALPSKESKGPKGPKRKKP